VAGYVAPRHLKAIKDTGNELVAAMDKSDSVGILDQYFPETAFFTEFERLERYLAKLKNEGQGIDYFVVCTPNYLHDTHVRFGLRLGADVICEKPLVLNPHNIKAIENEEKATGKKVFTILQLRLQPVLQKLKNELIGSNDFHHVKLEYITPRGNWYHYSWKGDISKSGGLATNIGIHLFDLVLWLFGDAKSSQILNREAKKMSGILQFQQAEVRWTLSIDKNDLMDKTLKSYRLLEIDNKKIEFDNGFHNLHTQSYQEILSGRGFEIEDVKRSIEIVSGMR
ncbi:MAG: Gfo/Idh/MocA family oxidoreductase, partial [Chitinophagales bacterium]|nr:Gfo/Idh/MocA family oxidoreductase [Chitinophagales bacterium]